MTTAAINNPNSVVASASANEENAGFECFKTIEDTVKASSEIKNSKIAIAKIL